MELSCSTEKAISQIGALLGRPSQADPPFACPPDMVVDLPLPPSVNRIWQRRKAGKKAVSISKEYAAWQREADMHSLATRQLRGLKRIEGKFTAEIILKRSAGDLDNRVKAVLDWAQRRDLIENDKHCERLIVYWGDAPRGCRLIVRPCE